MTGSITEGFIFDARRSFNAPTNHSDINLEFFFYNLSPFLRNEAMKALKDYTQKKMRTQTVIIKPI